MLALRVAAAIDVRTRLGAVARGERERVPLGSLELEVDAQIARPVVVRGCDLARVRHRLVEVVAGAVEAGALQRREQLAAEPALHRRGLLCRLGDALPA